MFIQEYKDSLPVSFCKKLIEKFEEDPRKYAGQTAGYNYNQIKKSTDLHISGLPGYLKEDKQLTQSLHKHLDIYIKEYVEPCNVDLTDLLDTGYQIQRTHPGESYGWHNDHLAEFSGVKHRLLTYIWYLNNVERGGETEFISGEKVKPEVGKLLIFPATWTYAHQGVTPESNTKYICTGWLYHPLVIR